MIVIPEVIINILLIIFAVLLFEFIILSHEFGHFITAKLSGIRVNEFALGMGPKLIHFKRGETEYSLRAFPIGGFCAMEGEDESSDDPRAFGNKAVWKRILVVVAGAVMNILLGAVLMMVITGQQSVFSSTTVAEFTENSLTKQSGLRAGDEVVSINGYRVYTDRDMSFALASDQGIAQALESPQHASLLASMAAPVLQIFEALGIGLVLGAVHTLLIRFLPARHNRLALTIAFVLTATAVADMLGLSALLTTMAMGAVFANFCRQSAQVMEVTDRFTNPIYMMFFVLSGAGLNLSILPSIGLVGIIYVVVRVLGKLAGAWFGAVLMRGPAAVRRCLGPALLPQAGVAILCGTLIYELIGPGVAKWTLQRAGEIEKGA